VLIIYTIYKKAHHTHRAEETAERHKHRQQKSSSRAQHREEESRGAAEKRDKPQQHTKQRSTVVGCFVR
jgi:hypothetical protein